MGRNWLAPSSFVRLISRWLKHNAFCCSQAIESCQFATIGTLDHSVAIYFRHYPVRWDVHADAVCGSWPSFRYLYRLRYQVLCLGPTSWEEANLVKDWGDWAHRQSPSSWREISRRCWSWTVYCHYCWGHRREWFKYWEVGCLWREGTRNIKPLKTNPRIFWRWCIS